MTQNDPHFAEDLSQRQLAALPNLLRPGPLTVQARHAGVGRTTLYRWLQDENFRECLEWLRKETMQFTQAHLQAMSHNAVAVLDDALNHDSVNVPASSRTRPTTPKATGTPAIGSRLSPTPPTSVWTPRGAPSSWHGLPRSKTGPAHTSISSQGTAQPTNRDNHALTH